MKSHVLLILLLSFSLFIIPFSSAAHFIVGFVDDAQDGELADNHTVILWNPTNGITDNVSDIIGPQGNSGASNFYLIDCELLSTPCAVGDIMTTRVIDTGDSYFTIEVNTTVTGDGFDVAPNLSLNSVPRFTSLLVDDAVPSPSGEIDLLAATTRFVSCEGVLVDNDGEGDLVNASAELFDNALSSFGDSDDNNLHYTNTSCFINTTYGNENESLATCGFDVHYYANQGTWNCSVSPQDNLSAIGLNSNTSIVNQLLAIGVQDSIDFGTVNALTVSDEQTVNVTNFGNVPLNLSFEGYGRNQSDGLAMNCTQGATQNISVFYEKYNLTESNPGVLTHSQFDALYVNLTNTSIVRDFDLEYRQNDVGLNATNGTYWRIFVPSGVAGTCSGNIILGASIAAGS